MQERLILGIDPGTNVTGYGLILIEKDQPKLIQYGVIHLSGYASHPLKLKKLFERILHVIEEYKPDEAALEAPFYGKNVQSMLKLGRAQGVAMAAALSREIPITEYAPKKIKQSVTGNGNASKEQVARMLMQILHFQTEAEELLDATDALAVALCHYYQRNAKPKSKASGWAGFLQDNPDRLRS